MRTDDLICMMAKTPPCCSKKRNMRIWASVAALFLVFVAVIAATIGLREDLELLFESEQMLLKYGFLIAAVIASGLAWWRSGHPTRCCKTSYFALIALAAFLVVMVAQECMSETVAQLSFELFDNTAVLCAVFVAAFAVIGSYVLTKITGCMAPTNCKVHAFMTALFATSLGALAYGLHCSHDHPSYLALWYGGTGLVFVLIALPVIMKKQRW